MPSGLMNTTNPRSDSRRTRSASGCSTADGSSVRSAARTSPDAARASASDSARSRCCSTAWSSAVRTARTPAATTATTTTTTCSSRSWRARLIRPTGRMMPFLTQVSAGTGRRVARGLRERRHDRLLLRLELRVDQRRVVEGRVEALLVELALPAGDHHRRDAVADAVRQRAALGHDPVDPDHERDADGDRLGAEERPAERLQRRRQRDEPGARDAGSALRGEDHERRQGELLADRHVLPGRLHDEQRARASGRCRCRRG